MGKFIVFLVFSVFFFAITVSGQPDSFDDSFSDEDDDPFKDDDDDDFANKKLSADDIENLKKDCDPNDKNCHVQGEYKYASSSVKYVNGKLVENKSNKQKVVNKDGKVTKSKNDSDC